MGKAPAVRVRRQCKPRRRPESSLGPPRIMAYYPVPQAALHGGDLETGVEPCATRARYPVHRPRKSCGEGCGCGQSRTSSTVQGADLPVGQLPTITDRPLLRCGKVNMYPLPSAGHLVTIAGCSVHWNPRTDAREHEQVFGARER